MNSGHSGAVTVRLICLAGALAVWTAGPGAAQALEPSDEAKALAEEAATAPGTAAQSTATATATKQATAATPRKPKTPVIPRIRSVQFVNGTSYLNSEEVKAAVAPFVGQRATNATLANLQNAVNALYVRENIGLAQAVVENAQGGTIRMRLIEARLGNVIYNAPGLSDDYLGYRLGFAPGQLADTRRLTSQLQRFGWTDGLQADATFAPGADVGTTDLTITYPPIKPVTGYVALDNYVSQTNGKARLSFGVTRNSLTGRNDPLSLAGTVTEGTRSLTLSYSTVVSPGGDRLGVVLNYERGRVTAAPARESRKLGATVTYSHPLALSDDRRLYLTGALDVYDESAKLAGVTTSDQRGAAINIGLTSQQAAGDGVFGWALGVTAGQYSDRVTGGTNIGSARVNGSLDWRGPISEGIVAVMAGAFQVPITSNLPAHDNFTVTAAQIVPGYDESISAGPGGYWLRAQIESAQSIGGLGQDVDMRPYAFAAMGEAFNLAGGTLVGQGTAAAIGVGMTGRINQTVGFDVQVAAPQTRVLGSGGKGTVTISAAVSAAF
ncbi:ShlB/FhaC/HecB family hemolysin secretion/activation protein [Pseudooceanicola sp. MF1-13]|uniref:ShlB/FhaC/HecB family hemolysin secretion/activation protein n=1 Tax=Pseudooceanicola sp. MF1-13 TaxID=3379095 RepID=UPI0038923DC2